MIHTACSQSVNDIDFNLIFQPQDEKIGVLNDPHGLAKRL